MGVMGTLLNLAILMVFAVAITAAFLGAAFFVFVTSVRIAERLHRRRADRAGFADWLDHDRTLHDDGLLERLAGEAGSDQRLALDGAPMFLHHDLIDLPDEWHPLAVEPLGERTRLRIWTDPAARERVDVAVLQRGDTRAVRLEPIGPHGWMRDAHERRRLPMVGGEGIALLVTDRATVDRLGVDGLEASVPSWPEPPDADRASVPLVDGTGRWLQAGGFGAAFLMRDEAGDEIGVGVAFGALGRPRWAAGDR